MRASIQVIISADYPDEQSETIHADLLVSVAFALKDRINILVKSTGGTCHKIEFKPLLEGVREGKPI